MSANIFIHEFRTRFKSVLIWSLSIAGLTCFFFSLFPVFANQAVLLNEFLAKYPPQLRAAFGMNNMDLSSVLGFYSLLFLFIQLCLAKQASNYGFGLVSIEESELTADFLLSKRVSRIQVLTSKLLAALASLTLTNLVIWASTFAAIAIFRENKTLMTIASGDMATFRAYDINELARSHFHDGLGDAQPPRTYDPRSRPTAPRPGLRRTP